MAYTDTVLADAPLRYWPLDDTSGTSARELVAAEAATAVGLTMGTAAASVGLGGVCPNFTGGTEHIVLRTAKLLGGQASFTIEAWVKYQPSSTNDATVRAFYGEAAATGNDLIRAAVANGSSSQLQMIYGEDGAASVSNTASTIFISGAWVLMHYCRIGTTMEMWWNGGRRMATTNFAAGSTWTNAGVEAWLGNTIRATSPWGGQIAHVAVYDKQLTTAQKRAHYAAGTPRTRVPPSRSFWKPGNAVWNQKLTNPGNPPAIASNSATLVARLVNQATTNAPTVNDGGGTFWTVDNATPKQAVRILGGAADNPSTDKPALWNALQQVPVPTDFVAGATSTDKEAQIFNSSTGELWEFWVMARTLLPPAWLTYSAGGSGTLSAGAYGYYVKAALADGSASSEFVSGTAVTLNGSQGTSVSWGESEGAVSYKVYRTDVGLGFASAKLLATVTAPTRTFFDDGSGTRTTLMTAEAVSVTSDWGCKYAGYIPSVDVDLGYYTAPRVNWGASATSLPLWGGTISLEEAKAYNIPHALALALVQTANSHVFPAQRHDYFGGTDEIPEGTRFQLDPAYDTTQIANPFMRAVAKAFQDYGGIVRDHSGGTTLCYIEDQTALGRDEFPGIYDGKLSYEVLVGFPTSSLRVIDPAWTLAQTTASLEQVVPKAQLPRSRFGGRQLSRRVR